MARDAGHAIKQGLAESGGYTNDLDHQSWLEEQRLIGLQNRARGESAEQLKGAIGQAQRDASGAAAGQGAMGLRSSSYAQGDIAQRGATEGDLLKAMEEQAFREQQLAMLGRRGDYNVWGMQGRADSYSQALQQEANEYLQEIQDEIAEEAAIMGGVGVAAGAAGALIGGMGSDPVYKEDVRAAAPSAEDRALAALAASRSGQRAPSAEDRALAALAASRSGQRAPAGATLQEVKRTSTPEEDALLAIADAYRAEDAKTGRALAAPRSAADERLSRIADQLAADDEKALSALKGEKYRYRAEAQSNLPPGLEAPDGERYGPMANKLRSTQLGKTMLTPDGKAIDYGKATVGTMGLVGRLGERTESLEERIARLEKSGALSQGPSDQRTDMERYLQQIEPTPEQRGAALVTDESGPVDVRGPLPGRNSLRGMDAPMTGAAKRLPGGTRETRLRGHSTGGLQSASTRVADAARRAAAEQIQREREAQRMQGTGPAMFTGGAHPDLAAPYRGEPGELLTGRVGPSSAETMAADEDLLFSEQMDMGRAQSAGLRSPATTARGDIDRIAEEVSRRARLRSTYGEL